MKLGKSRRKQLLVRIRMNTALKPNDYWSLLRPILVGGLTYIGLYLIGSICTQAAVWSFVYIRADPHLYRY